MRDLVKVIVLADQVGLDSLGIGEHHTSEMPASAAATILARATTATRRIRLGSAVTVLSTDDPVRVFQQFATVDAISGGRGKVTAGRGSSVESYPLFGCDLSDYEVLYEEKLRPLIAINESERATWSGTTRASLHDALVVPRPDAGRHSAGSHPNPPRADEPQDDTGSPAAATAPPTAPSTSSPSSGCAATNPPAPTSSAAPQKGSASAGSSAASSDSSPERSTPTCPRPPLDEHRSIEGA